MGSCCYWEGTSHCGCYDTRRSDSKVIASSKVRHRSFAPRVGLEAALAGTVEVAATIVTVVEAPVTAAEVSSPV